MEPDSIEHCLIRTQIRSYFACHHSDSWASFDKPRQRVWGTPLMNLMVFFLIDNAYSGINGTHEMIFGEDRLKKLKLFEDYEY